MSCFRCLGSPKKSTKRGKKSKSVGGTACKSDALHPQTNSSADEVGNAAPTVSGNNKSGAVSFLFKELASATQNFKEGNLIGEGGFGKVFKGRLESGQTFPPM